MMSLIMDNLIGLLNKFDISTDESQVYLYLLERGIDTPLEISRRINIPRTKVYRILDKLVNKGLVAEKIDYSGHKFIANSPAQLELLILEKENEVRNLRESMPVVLEQLSKIETVYGSDSKVLYYKGIEGLKQVTWNSLKAERELLTMEISDMNAFLDQSFAEKVRKEIVNRKIFTRNLTNRKKIGPWTKIKEAVTDYWEVRYIDPEDFEINFDILIYNDVYCMYDYQDNNVFCVEIYNEKLVKMQKQIYEFMWKGAKEMKVLNDRGEAEVV